MLRHRSRRAAGIRAAVGTGLRNNTMAALEGGRRINGSALRARETSAADEVRIFGPPNERSRTQPCRSGGGAAAA
jgi:hypothetical protein